MQGGPQSKLKSRAGRTPHTQTRLIRDEVVASLKDIQRAYNRLLESSPGPVRRAVDLRRALGLGAELSWQVFKIARSEDPVSAASLVPRPGSLATLVKQAREHRVPRSAIEAIERAHAGYERILAQHAGDRAAFDSMLGELGGAAEQVEMRQRRAAFRANSYLWGCQAEARVSCVVLSPSSAPGRMNVAQIAGAVGLWQARPGVYYGGRSQVMQTLTRTPAPFESTEGWILEDFCSQPLPRMELVSESDGCVRTEFHLENIGRTAAVSLMRAQVFREAEWDDSGTQSSVMGVVTPMEVFVHDLLVPRGTTDPQTVAATCFGNVAERDVAHQMDERDVLPRQTSAYWAGTGLESLRAAEIPRYPEMAAQVFDRLGWNGDEFDVYRCRIRYPMLHSVVRLSVAIRERSRA